MEIVTRHSSDNFAIYVDITSLCCISETNVIYQSYLNTQKS